MMELGELIQSIQSYFADQWHLQAPALVNGLAPPVIYDNLGSENGAPPEPPFVEFTVQVFLGGQITLGESPNRRFAQDGLVTVAIHVPMGEGEELLNSLLGAVRDMFAGVHVGEVWFRNVRPRRVGRTGRGTFQSDILADFSAWFQT